MPNFLGLHYTLLPEVIISDNGIAFTSQEFQAFVKQNGIKHVKTAAYHSASNGLAERYVQIVKDRLKKITGDSIESSTPFKIQSDTSVYN